MKRILALLLAMIMLLSLCACGNNTTDNTDGGTAANTESSTTGTEETTGNTEKIDETTSATDGTEATEKLTEQSKPTQNVPSSTTTPSTTPSDDFKENKDTITSETIIGTPQKEDCKHKNMTYVPNDNDDVPTCTKSGYYLKWCPDCFVQIKVEAEAIGHTGGTAACSSLAKCTRCQQEYGKFDTTKHIRTAYNMMRNAITPTCEKDGYEGDVLYCLDCDETLEKGKVLKATGHSLSIRCINGEYKTEEYCKNNCGYSKYENLERLNITFEKTVFDGNYLIGVQFYISGGYGGKGDRYTAETCIYGRDESDPWFQETYIRIKDYFLTATPTAPEDLLGQTVKVVVTDYYGHSLTQKFTFVEDPNNSQMIILQKKS